MQFPIWVSIYDPDSLLGYSEVINRFVIISMDVYANNEVKGYWYDVVKNELLPLDGEIDYTGDQYKVVAADKIIVSGYKEEPDSGFFYVSTSSGIKISGQASRDGGWIRGNWTTTELERNLYGAFYGNGCKLN